MISPVHICYPGNWKNGGFTSNAFCADFGGSNAIIGVWKKDANVSGLIVFKLVLPTLFPGHMPSIVKIAMLKVKNVFEYTLEVTYCNGYIYSIRFGTNAWIHSQVTGHNWVFLLYYYKSVVLILYSFWCIFSGLLWELRCWWIEPFELNRETSKAVGAKNPRKPTFVASPKKRRKSFGDEIW